jgi:rhodanese-related sulfurtransferase
MTVPTVTGVEVREVLQSGTEIALLDVRIEAVYARAHPLWAACLPVGRIPLEAPIRLPRCDVAIVVLDDGEGLAEAAATRLDRLGYTDVSLLEGGLAGWAAGGGEVFQDVNVPSKAFGELVEAVCATPSIPAGELATLLASTADVVVVDVRRFDEYATMSIPGATSIPGGELVHRISALAPDPETMVVVNCAGRTRSIIGTQSLRNVGLPNPTVALRNGTIGWSLEGLELDHDRSHRAPDPVSHTRAEAAARILAQRAGVRFVAPDELASLTPPDRTVYRVDVRDPYDHALGYPADFTSVPGGQLVQETDHTAPVRSARFVLAGDGTARAPMTASWLAQMGWETFVVDDLVAWSERAGRSVRDGVGPTTPPRPTEDRYRRPYEGRAVHPAAMQAYLDWEHGLVAQLERDGTHGFDVLTPDTTSPKEQP